MTTVFDCNKYTEQCLDTLRDCAKNLLSAYTETMHPDYFAAYEETVQACKTLHQKKLNGPIIWH